MVGGYRENATPRNINPRRRAPQMAIYTDAASETMIMAANVLGVRIYKRTKRMEACREIRADPRRGRICAEQETNLSCVREMAPAVQTVADKSLDLDNKCITFYIDNDAAKCGWIKSESKVPILSILSRIFRVIVAYRNITHGLNVWIQR